MGRTISPLRYPGGKACLLNATSALLRENALHCGHYAEPFAGGCGLALGLLFSGSVAEIHINDVDRAIWSFWKSALDHTDELISLIRRTPVTIAEWHKQREILRACDADVMTLGFSAFFLNRTNRSGVIKGGGVIGGLDQTGKYKIDCRFNVDDLTRRIRRVGRYRDQINLTNLDALDHLELMRNLPKRSLLFIDPPYFRKGPGLYTSFYKPDDHAKLASRVMRIETPWVTTYDDVPQIRSLYINQRRYSFDIHYSLQEKRTGTELLIVSDNLIVPEIFADRSISEESYLAA